jgi:hypothetical protein
MGVTDNVSGFKTVQRQPAKSLRFFLVIRLIPRLLPLGKYARVSRHEVGEGPTGQKGGVLNFPSRSTLLAVESDDLAGHLAARIARIRHVAMSKEGPILGQSGRFLVPANVQSHRMSINSGGWNKPTRQRF